MPHEPSGIALLYLPALAVLAVLAWCIVRVLRKAGLSGWWTPLAFVPLLNLVMIWVFAFARWPNEPVPSDRDGL